MLLTERHEPIESDEWLNELKLDGIRCVAYLRPGETDLRNKRNLRLLPSFPELAGLHEAVAQYDDRHCAHPLEIGADAR